MQIPTELIEQIQKGNVVLFCGAGISMGPGGVPSGWQLTQELAKGAELGDVSRMELPEVAQAYEQNSCRSWTRQRSQPGCA